MAPKSLFYTLFTSLTVALAASVPQTDYEVIIVGGGPAGLSVLSGLSRVRRKTALFDSGEYRNSATRNMHDVIGNDGTVPSEFRGLAREQISKYDTATFIDKKINTIEPVSDKASNASYFLAKDADGKEYTARKLVLGTGLVDDLPDTPGLKEAWGKGVYWCPWCDGYEHRDEPFGILGALPDVVGSVLEVYTLNKDIVAFVNGTQTADAEAELGAKYPNWEAQLEAYNVRLENATIESFERIQDGGELKDRNGTRQLDIFRVHFTNGSSVDRNAFITNFPSEQRSDLPRQLGLAMLGNKIDATTNPGMRTSVSGVFAVGDCNSDNSTNVPHAMFSGKRAAVYLHVEMAKEESKAVINKRGGVKVMLKETEKRMGDEMQMIYNRARGL
ncbi:hypothetical protein BDV29DRAFT_170857 [Aspergillus leporis]|uniref:FAD/NAD(P)-binding domain-containing protein n=1 Tax=Aspergillus leporis TaxID=41062 RepID=A0A5N5X5P1_9EURO|nr:hypothetical protein BDV29DRAFT_170857 [Aspergillus leporis]